jgi:hypothetical protein
MMESSFPIRSNRTAQFVEIFRERNLASCTGTALAGVGWRVGRVSYEKLSPLMTSLYKFVRITCAADPS